ncbi:hypothetical protein M0802_011770 [Mischocyttarus mexicanus]|nr:hypothetical protein M0802_011770 [Mischocyttarus mexicanus]
MFYLPYVIVPLTDITKRYVEHALPFQADKTRGKFKRQAKGKAFSNVASPYAKTRMKEMKVPPKHEYYEYELWKISFNHGASTVAALRCN